MTRSHGIHGAADAAKIDKRVSTHTLRLSLATHLLEQKVGLDSFLMVRGSRQ